MFKQHLLTLFAFLALAQFSYAQCVGGNVVATSGASTIYTCPGDGNADMVSFMVEGASAETNYQFVVTDSDFNIVGIPPGNMIDVEGAGEGTCYVWGFAYTGDFVATTGMNVFQVQVATGCWNLSKKALKVVRSAPDAGTVALNDGRTEKMICTADGYDNIAVYTNTSASNAAFQYVVTDDSNNILAVLSGSNQNFEGVPPGVCRVWGLSYTGNLTAMAGDNAAEVALSDGCFDLSDNYITVTRSNVDGGTVATMDGETSIMTIPGDGISDAITFMHESSSASDFVYIVTDEDNKVIGTPPSNTIDFEGAGEGVCRVWGVSYTGDLKYLIGGTVGNFALSTDCFDVSENFVEVVRSAGSSISGGTVAMPSGATEKYICANDGVSDVIMVVSEGATEEANFTLVVTDPAGNILGVPPANMVDVTGAGVGTCLVWGLSYTGDLTAMVGDNAMTAMLASGDAALSSNYITLNRDETNGGTVAMPSGATEKSIIVSDGEADVIEFTHEGESNSNYAYVVTDEAGTILGLPGGNSLDFEGAGEGVCLVWGLAFTGEIIAMVGDNATEVALSSECFDLSDNFITITRTTADNFCAQNGITPDGGMVQLAGGGTTYSNCAGDIVFDVEHTTTANSLSYWYIITDDNDNILGFHNSANGSTLDLSGAPAGTCRIWGWNYRGLDDPIMGDPISTLMDDFCEDISDNFITVNRQVPDGGMVQLVGGGTEYNGTAGDIVFDVEHTTTANSLSYWYIITDDNDNILGFHNSANGNTLDLSGAPAGTCRIWGWNYKGLGDPIMGDPISTLMDDFCEDISDNFITVNRGNSLPSNAVLLNSTTTNSVNLNMFPNPVMDLLEVSLNNNTQIDTKTQVRVFDVLGRTVLQQQEILTTGANTFQLNVAKLAAGTYILNIENTQTVTSKTFVKN